MLCPTTTPVLVQASYPIAFPSLTCIVEEDMQRQELCLLNLRGSNSSHGIPGTVTMEKGDTGDGEGGPGILP